MIRFGLIGERLGHSYSRVIHEYYFKIMRMDAVYEMIEIPKPDFDTVLPSILQENFRGINVTIPYKQEVIRHLDEISSDAEIMNAVNTITRKNGIVKGFNTDFFGIIHTFERFGIKIFGKNVVILGTGGAAQAVFAVCKHLRAGKISFVSRDNYKCDGCETLSYGDKISGDVLINATPVGMYPHVDGCPIEGEIAFECVFDLIYNPCETVLLKRAKTAGLCAVNGLYMLIAQGIMSQAIWNDISVDGRIIDKIYDGMKGIET